MKSYNPVEMNRQGLRIVQIACLVVAVAACVMVARLGISKTNTEIKPIQWAIVVAAIYCALSGFTMRAKLLTGRRGLSKEKGAPRH
ncbi:MAG: hypothetical protein ACXVJ1_13730 [Candidatus Angelobacter sp.]